MTDQAQIKRICASCGIEKPIAAFLQISGKQGTNYGSICATCRAAGRTVKHPLSTDEDSSTATTDKRIGSKEKTYLEQERIRQQKERKEREIKEIKKRETEAHVKMEESELKEKAEKDHRKFYIDTKHIQGFLSQKKPADTPVVEQQAKQQLENIKENQQKTEIQKQEDIIKQEVQMTSLDFSMPAVASQTGQLRFQADTFLKFQSWLGKLGNQTPTMKTLDFLYEKHKAQPHAKKSVFESKPSDSKASVEEYMEKRLDQPSGTRRR